MTDAIFAVKCPEIKYAFYREVLVEYSLEDFGSGTYYCVVYEEFSRIRDIFCANYKNPASLIEDLQYYIALDVSQYCKDDICDIIDRVSISYEP
jgi:hypothetical protein